MWSVHGDITFFSDKGQELQALPKDLCLDTVGLGFWV